MRIIKASFLGFSSLTSLLRHFRRRPLPVLSSLVIAAALMTLGATFVKKNRPDPETACADLVNLTKFPVTPTQITLAKWNPSGTTTANGVPLPDHCQIQGIIQSRTGTDGNHYGTRFEVRLPSTPIGTVASCSKGAAVRKGLCLLRRVAPGVSRRQSPTVGQ